VIGRNPEAVGPAPVPMAIWPEIDHIRTGSTARPPRDRAGRDETDRSVEQK
jgi:hypothetical protein